MRSLDFRLIDTAKIIIKSSSVAPLGLAAAVVLPSVWVFIQTLPVVFFYPFPFLIKLSYILGLPYYVFTKKPIDIRNSICCKHGIRMMLQTCHKNSMFHTC
jgi:hypothetical protein